MPTLSRLRHTFPLLAGLLLAACTSPNPQSLQEGFQKYSAFKADESETIADRYIAANPNAADIDQAYYLRGISRMTRGNRTGAAADLRVALTKTTRADLRSKAYRSLGDIAYDEGQWADAIKDYLAAMDNLALDAKSVTYLNYRLGATLQAQGEWTRAEDWFTKVIAANDDPALADRALRRLHANHFAIQYGAFHEVADVQKLAAQLQAAGISATTNSEIRQGGVIWYLVQSGSYSTMVDAAAARDRVLARFPDAIIVP